MKKDFSLQEIKDLTQKNNSFKKTLEEIKEKIKEITILKKELTQLNDELIHFDIIDMLSEKLIDEENLEELISISTSIKHCKEYFSNKNLNLEYLEKTRKLEKVLKIKSFNKLIEFMNKGDGFVKDSKVKELIGLNEDLKNIFKKHFFSKRQKEFYKKIEIAKNKESVCFLIQHELNLKECLFKEESDMYLYTVLCFYYEKLSKEEIISYLTNEPIEESDKIFYKYLKMLYEEKFGKQVGENVFDL